MPLRGRTEPAELMLRPNNQCSTEVRPLFCSFPRLVPWGFQGSPPGLALRMGLGEGGQRPPSSLGPQTQLLRKEVIQPHLPVRLPCYDFVPIASPTFDGSLPYGLGHRLRVLPTFVT